MFTLSIGQHSPQVFCVYSEKIYVDVGKIRNKKEPYLRFDEKDLEDEKKKGLISFLTY